MKTKTVCLYLAGGLAAFLLVLLVSPALGEESPQQLLANSRAAWEAVDDYQWTMSSFIRKGNKETNSTYLFYFKKPFQVRMDVTGGRKRGSGVVLTKEGKIRGHQGGLLAGIILTLSPKDKRLKDIRGKTFLDPEWSIFLKHLETLLAQGNQASLKEESLLEGQPTEVLEIIVKEPADEISREIIWFDKGNKNVVKYQCFSGDELVLENIISDFKANQGLEDCFFEM